MSRSRFCKVCKDFHDVEVPWPADCIGHFAAPSAGAGEARFHVVSDSIPAFRSMADGKMYDSKSRYRADLRARGLVELGNDQVKRSTTPLPPVRDDMRRAIQQLGG